MSDLAPWRGAGALPAAPRTAAAPQPANLADLLERVLDKGIVIAGDIRINLLDIELLTIKIRLLIASVDRAREMGIDWWEHDPTLSSGRRDLAAENRRLRERLGELEAGRGEPAARAGPPARAEPEDESDADAEADAASAPRPARRAVSARPSGGSGTRRRGGNPP
ncbi:gas vesicle protein [Streptomyces sp. NRRL S-350]|uniref:gas vesicle protein n=1 Tax=Streptomyces sp. NRRL S-350 TaxID=1463902 RepID=UPI0004BF2655|nr:gas vesicle protein [Streptomyces sp. NRRL S-350]